MSWNHQGKEFHYTSNASNGRSNGSNRHSGSAVNSNIVNGGGMDKSQAVYDMTRMAPNYYEQRHEHHGTYRSSVNNTGDAGNNMTTRTRRSSSPSTYREQQRSDIGQDHRRDNRYRSSSPATNRYHYPEHQYQHQKIRNDSQFQQHYQEEIQHQQQSDTSTPQTQQSMMYEEEYNIKVMKEREKEILKINQQMRTVGDIYKDLAALVEGQQELIDQIDNQIDLANGYTQSGRENFKTAKMRAENPLLEDPFGDKLGSKGRRHTSRSRGEGLPPTNNANNNQNTRRRKKSSHGRLRSKSKSRHSSQKIDNIHNIDCTSPLEAMPKDMQRVLKVGFNDMKELGSRLITACTVPDIQQENEYAFKSKRGFTENLQHDYASRQERLTHSEW